MPIVRAARDVNQRQRAIAVERLQDELRILKGRKIGLLGIAFKPNTDDLRDSPALDIANLLIARGARVKLHDPVAGERFRREQPELAPHLSETLDELFDDCDAVVLVTEWAQYLELDWAQVRRPDAHADPARRPARAGRRPDDPARLQVPGHRRLTPGLAETTGRPAGYPRYPGGAAACV